MRDFENKQPFDYAATAHKRTSTPYSACFSHILLENAITNVRNRTFVIAVRQKSPYCIKDLSVESLINAMQVPQQGSNTRQCWLCAMKLI